MEGHDLQMVVVGESLPGLLTSFHLCLIGEVLIDRKYLELAVQALHDAFGLDKAS